MKQKVPLDDIQVQKALKAIEYSYKRISELQELLTSNNLILAWNAKTMIDFFKTRIALNQKALQKVGIIKFRSEN